MLRQQRLAGVPRLQFVNRSRKVCRDPSMAKTVKFQNGQYIMGCAFQQLQQPVFNFDVVIGSGQTSASGSFQRARAGGVKFANQRFEIHSGHDSLLKNEEWEFNKDAAQQHR